ncbi:MAG: DMT family transporter [Pseudomonadota bacterium]
MDLYHIAALSTAFCWAMSSFLAAAPNSHLGAIAYTRLRMLIVFVVFSLVVLARGTLHTTYGHIELLAISGFVGIFLGDGVKFIVMRRIGPRRTAMLIATNGPISALISYFYLGELLSALIILGCGLVVAGVLLAIAYSEKSPSVYEHTEGSLALTVCIGIFAAACQALGAVLAKPALLANADLVSVTTVRVGFAVLCFYLLLLLPSRHVRATNPLTAKVFLQTAASGLLAMGLGMTLLLFALKGTEVGVATTLSSTSLIFLLIILWAATGKRPRTGGIIAAVLAVTGTAIITQG